VRGWDRVRRAAVPAGVLALLLGVGCAPAPGSAQNSLEAAASAFRTGAYPEALAAYQAAAGDRSASREVHLGLVRTFLELGRYTEAEEAARRGEALHGAGMAGVLGEALEARGQLDAAQEAYRRAVEGGAPDALTARYRLAALRYRRGDREAALREFDAFIDVYNRGGARGGDDLTAVASAVWFLGTRDPVLAQDALRAFDEAIAAGGDGIEPRVRVGELFLEKYNSAEALQSFQEVLELNPRHPRALLGRARALNFSGAPGAMQAVQQALEVSPDLVEARVFLGHLHLGLEDLEGAEREARRALEVNPASLEALSLLAAARYLAGDPGGFQEARDRALQVNPRYAGLYTTVAEASVNNRRYADAVEFARLAVQLDSTAWRAWGILGINQLRMAEMEPGRRSLETAFAGDPYNIWFKNTLDLLDSMTRFREVELGPLTLVLREDEADLLAPLVGEVAEEAYRALAQRYGVPSSTPVRIELYPDSRDFSVRTVGLTGIGALGVAFGRVVAMDSPSARPVGEFNWASTLWHEMAHVVHLALSRSRMPRWFGEGLAVYEQRQADPGWGQGVTPGFLRAFHDGLLLPVSNLNQGFVRPSYPEQIGHSYLQASLVCDLIAEEHGEAALVEMLRAYGRGLDNEAVIRSVLGMEPHVLDARFEAYLRERFQGALAALATPLRLGPPLDREETLSRARGAPGDYRAQRDAGAYLFQEGEGAAAIPFLERARELFPEYGGNDGPDWMLARIHQEAGNAEAALAALERLTRLNESHYHGTLLLAELRESLGDRAGAAAALERVLWIHPFDPGVLARLAALQEETGNWEGAVRGRRGVVALNPVNRAEALYRLARAHAGAGDAGAARREVIRALELAPGYPEAQELLLELTGGGSR